MNYRMRLFIGLPMDEEGRRGVAGVVKRLIRKHWKVRWEPEEKWHVTVAFIGVTQRDGKILRFSGGTNSARNTQDDTLDLRSLSSASSAFEVWFKGVDTFPKQEMTQKYGERWHGRQVKRLTLRQKPAVILPKLIYVRLGGELKAMHKLVTSARKGLKAAGVEYDDKPFVPHLTIGRISVECGRAERIEIGKTVGKLYDMDIPQRWVVGRVCLYESELRPAGSVYRVLEEWPFNGNGREEQL